MAQHAVDVERIEVAGEGEALAAGAELTRRLRFDNPRQESFEIARRVFLHLLRRVIRLLRPLELLFLEREDPSDILISGSGKGLDALPAGRTKQ